MSKSTVLNHFLTLFLLVAPVMHATTAQADSHKTLDRVISVSGSAQASVEPDQVSVRFGVETQDQTSSMALAANAELMKSVIDAIQKAGIASKEISTSQFSIQAVYESQIDQSNKQHRQVLTGYRVSNVLQVETGKLDLVAGIIDSAVEAGVNRVDGVQFQLSAERMSDLKERLIAQAVTNARSRAELALTPLGYQISGVRDMSINDFVSPMPRYGEGARMEMAMAAPTQIFSSEQDVTSTVNVTFLIEKTDRQDN